MVTIDIESSVAPLVRVAAIEAEGLTVRAEEEAVRAEIGRMQDALRVGYAGGEPAQIEGLRAARDLYHRIGIDPTKLRPSSEALLRRVLRGQDLPAINSLVDTSNLCSLEFLLPIGLHDLARVEGPLTLRRGRPGEGYEAIGKGWYRVEDRLTLADTAGACGSPTSDSQRTMITAATTHALMVIYAPRDYPDERLAGHLETAAGRITRFSGGRISGTALLPAAR